MDHTDADVRDEDVKQLSISWRRRGSPPWSPSRPSWNGEMPLLAQTKLRLNSQRTMKMAMTARRKERRKKSAKKMRWV